MRNTPILNALLALAIAAPTFGQEQSSTAIHCGKVYIGNGQVTTDVYIVIVNGKIDRLTRTRPDDARIIDASDKVVIPGIVAADSDLAANPDHNYNVTPDFVALEGFDLLSENKRAMSGGVTTAYLSPGRQRFVSGQGSVVKMSGEDMVSRVLKERATLRITLGKEASNAPDLFEPPVHPTADDPLVSARRQFPSSRISQLNELRRIFQAAQAVDATVQGQGATEDRYDVTPLQDAVRGNLPLRIGAKEAPDIRNAIRFAAELGIALVLETPYEIEKALAIHDGPPLSAVFRLPVRPGRKNPGGERPDEDTPRNRPENPVIAAQAGARVAIAPGADDDLRDFLLVASIAIRMGLTEEQALRAITLDAAELVGVADRVGSLEPGKDADLAVLSGEPFAVGTMVEDTYVDGELAFHRDVDSDTIVVKARRIITLEGQTIEDGAVFVSGGKIIGIGKEQTIPYGARVIDMGDGVIVPGFIDAYCHAGLSDPQNGIPAGQPSHRLTQVIQHDDPVFRQLLEAGLTTVFVSGRDANLVSGRVAAVKTGASDRDAMVLKEIAGIRFVHDAITPNGIQALEAQIDRGKAYIAAWEKYEKDLAAFNRGEEVDPSPAQAAPTEAPAPDDPITGTWDVELSNFPVPVDFTLELVLDGTTVTGTAQATLDQQVAPPAPITEGRFEDNTIHLVLTINVNEEQTASVVLEGQLVEGALAGTINVSGPQPVEGQFQAVRRAATEQDPPPAQETEQATEQPPAQTTDGPPQPPAVDQSLEPLRALLQKQIPAVISTTRAPAIQQIVESFVKNQLPFILQGASDAVATPEILGSSRPGFMFTPEILTRDGADVQNAAARISDQGLPVSLVSGDTEGARYLPLHAALAIRYGMEPTEALKAITINPARMFNLDDRVGSLRRGKDADFVVFSGNPLEMTSQVQLVVVNGKVVVDNRK